MERSNFFSNYNMQNIMHSYSNISQESFNNGATIKENSFFSENHYQQLNNNFTTQKTNYNNQNTFTYPHQLFEDNNAIQSVSAACEYNNLVGRLFNSGSSEEQYDGVENSFNLHQNNEQWKLTNDNRKSSNDVNVMSKHDEQSIQNLQPTFEQMKFPLDEESLASLSESELNKYIFGTVPNVSNSHEKMQNVENEQTPYMPTGLQEQVNNENVFHVDDEEEGERVHKLVFNDEPSHPILLIPGDSIQSYNLSNMDFSEFQEEQEPLFEDRIRMNPDAYQNQTCIDLTEVINSDTDVALSDENHTNLLTDQTDVKSNIIDGSDLDTEDGEVIEIVYMMPPVKRVDITVNRAITMESEKTNVEPTAPLKTAAKQRKQMLKPLPVENDLCENENYQLDKSKEHPLKHFKGVELPVLDVIFKRNKKKILSTNGIKGKKNSKGLYTANETVQESDIYKRKNEDRASYTSYEEKICVIPDLENQLEETDDSYYVQQDKENHHKSWKCDKCYKIFKCPLSIYKHKNCIGKEKDN